MKLARKSRYITVFITRRGVFQHTRLVFGVCLASEIFQKILERILTGLQGCANAFDDILVWGRTMEEHDEQMEAALKRLKEYNVLLKCVRGTTEAPFFGHILCHEEVKSYPSKIDAIRKFTKSTTGEHVRSFLGVITFANNSQQPTQ